MTKIQIKINREDLGFSPKQIKSLLAKFDLLSKTKDLTEFDIHLDFNKDDANELSIAIIWTLLRKYKNLKCNKNIKYKNNSASYFNERHFFDSLTGKKSFDFSPNIPINFETFSPVRPTKEVFQNDTIESIFKNAVKDVINEKNEFQNELGVHINELIQNTFDHSQSDDLNPAGILCSLTKTKLVDFCIVDMGQGIKGSFMSNPILKKKYSKVDDIYMIKEATEKRVSCNPLDARNPKYDYGNGGIGLFFLKEFVKKHKDSKLVIMSGGGYYYVEYMGNEKKLNLGHPWKGTIVYFRTKIDQEKSSAYKALVEDFIETIDNRDISVII